MREQILASQQRRRMVNEAFENGAHKAWDVQPHVDASQQYVRFRNAQLENVERRYPRPS